MTPPKAKKDSGKAATQKRAAKRATTKRGTETAETQGTGELNPAGTVGTALITRDSFTDLPVQFTIRDGTAYFEGDIILGSVDQLNATTEASRQDAKDVTQGLHRGVKPGSPVSNVDVAQGQPQSAVVIPGSNFRWPGGRIPFEVNATLTPAAQTGLTAAITHWQDRTRMSFRPRLATDTAWLNCQDATGCSSWVGRQGNRQDVNLSSTCGFAATVHELGHAVGLWHEQSREDRDRFVSILWANIQPAQQHNFNQHITDGDDVGGYDYGSIMHYGATAFGTTDPATGRTRTTIVPIQTLPPGTIIGQRNGLSVGDRAAVAQMYGAVYPGPGNTWVGRFEGGSREQLLHYSPARQVWHLGRTNNGVLTFTQVGDTSGFGDLDDGRPFWVGDFTGGGTTDLLFYYPGDDNWWLGTMQNGALVWSLVGNTAGFGHGINDGRPFWVGDFTGGGTTDLLFYHPGDDNWWLGSIKNVSAEPAICAQMRQKIAAEQQTIRDLQAQKRGLNPRDRGDLLEIRSINLEITAHRQVITAAQGTLSQNSCPLTPNPGGQQIAWSHVGNTAGFGHGINDGRPFWVGDFTGEGTTDILFHFRGDLNWWRGDLANGTLGWSLAATW